MICMRMEQLKYLVDIAETKSMSKTAERLFVSPQAVSKGIRQLEEELDVTLLVRTSTGAELTRIGEMVVVVAKEILKNEAQLNHVIAANKQYVQEENTVTVRVCSTSAIINIVLPDIMLQPNIGILMYITASMAIISPTDEQSRCPGRRMASLE